MEIKSSLRGWFDCLISILWNLRLKDSRDIAINRSDQNDSIFLWKCYIFISILNNIASFSSIMQPYYKYLFFAF